MGVCFSAVTAVESITGIFCTGGIAFAYLELCSKRDFTTVVDVVATSFFVLSVILSCGVPLVVTIL